MIIALPLLAALGWEIVRIRGEGPAGTGDLVVVPGVIDLGLARAGDMLSASARVENHGFRTITLGVPVADCGCMILGLDSFVLEPGESTSLSVQVKIGLEPFQERQVRLPGSYGKDLAVLTLTARAQSSLWLEPKFVHAGWVSDTMTPAEQWFALFIPDPPAASDPGSQSAVEVFFEGDCAGQSEFKASRGGLWSLGVRLSFKRPTLFGYLRSRVIVRSVRDPTMAASADIVVERVPAPSIDGWRTMYVPLAREQPVADVGFPASDFLEGQPSWITLAGRVLPALVSAGDGRTLVLKVVDPSVYQELPADLDLSFPRGTLRLRLGTKPPSGGMTLGTPSSR